MRTICSVKSPIGRLSALYMDGIIHRVFFPDESLPVGIGSDNGLDFSRQIIEYFEGTRKKFELPMMISGTPFRQAVYRAALMIPYGETASYSDVAFAAGHPRAMRAVGTAMRDIALPIIIPCHRVVRKASKKQAYRGGLDIKQYLLDLEQRYK